RKRRDADAAADEQRPADLEVEAVAERAEDVQLVLRLEDAERARPGPDRVDQKGELAARREAEAHRSRQEPTGRLEHEELPRHARIDPAAPHAQERVGPDPLVREDLTPLASHARSAPAGTPILRAARSRSRAPPPPRPRES